MVKVENVRCAGAVNIDQTDAPLIEKIGRVKPGTVIHSHFLPEAPIAQIRPVTDLPITYTYEINEPIARKIGEIDGLSTVCKDKGGTLFLIERLGYPLRRIEPGFGARRIPGESVPFSDENVCKTVAGQVYESHVSVIPVNVGQRLKALEPFPAVMSCPLIKPLSRTAEFSKVKLAVSSQIQELGAACREQHVRFFRHKLNRSKLR